MFQTTRFVGADFVAGLIGLIFAHGATTPALHQLAGIVGVPGVVLLAVAARRLVRDGLDQSPVSPSQAVIYDAGDVL